MVIHLSNSRRAASLMIELVAAIALLTGALLPIAYSLASEKGLAHASYQRAIAMEIVDGEMEILAAGEWRAFPPGVQDYKVNSMAVTNLPPGRFILTLETNKARLEWQPSVKMHGGPVVRETSLP
jgi:hypothetical protein